MPHVKGVTKTRYSLTHNICHIWCSSKIRTNTIYILAFPFLMLPFVGIAIKVAALLLFIRYYK